MSTNFGSKRLVVGAHYGFRDWLSQRVTAVLMVLFTLALIAQLLFGGPVGYDRWAGIFAQQWMKVLTLVVLVALGWHAWVGVRDMPAKGGKPDLALEEFARAVAYMARAAGATWKDPDAAMMKQIQAEEKKALDKKSRETKSKK